MKSVKTGVFLTQRAALSAPISLAILAPSRKETIEQIIKGPNGFLSYSEADRPLWREQGMTLVWANGSHCTLLQPYDSRVAGLAVDFLWMAGVSGWGYSDRNRVELLSRVRSVLRNETNPVITY